MGISHNTRLNWKRLQPERNQKLQRGANKSRSVRKILPTEYISCRESLLLAAQVLDISKKNKLSRAEILFSLAVKLLKDRGLFDKEHVQALLSDFSFSPHEELLALDIPREETDILGFIYQCLLSEGEKNTAGSYYTPRKIVACMVQDLDFSNGESFFDPCCGSGAFFLALQGAGPEQIFGCDKDPLAVFIAKVNLICRFPDRIFSPRILCCDYLAVPRKKLWEKKFDYIATNPPWGAARKGRCPVDSFSLFFMKAWKNLADNGKSRFLFPESLLKIRIHSEIRRFILTKCCLEKVVAHTGSFTGVMTKYVDIRVRFSRPEEFFTFRDGEQLQKIEVKSILNNKYHAFHFISDRDQEILKTVRNLKHHHLSPDSFALGIVTGDNKNKVKNTCSPGMEEVFTGREILPYTLKKPGKYLLYDRRGFQQVAPESFYRAPEKLVYKFISGQLVFSYDNSGALFLNSANILIPAIPGMSVKTVLAFLNSHFLRYYYGLLSKDIKILKSHLMRLPFPEISPENNKLIETFIDRILAGESSLHQPLQEIIYNCYQLSPEQTRHIEKMLFPKQLSR